jgi:hypothetical protein
VTHSDPARGHRKPSTQPPGSGGWLKKKFASRLKRGIFAAKDLVERSQKTISY